jgi:hypothetical protein
MFFYVYWSNHLDELKVYLAELKARLRKYKNQGIEIETTLIFIS